MSVLLPKLLLPSSESVGKHILSTLHGFKLIIDPSIDSGVELSLYETGTYEKGILDFIEKNFSENGVLLDVGANIGLMSIYTASKFPLAKVLAYEAHPDTYQILKDNIALNHLSNIATYQVAAGAHVGSVQIFDNWSVNRGGASIKYGDPGSSGTNVDMVVLDEELEVEPTMIKIDVEGAELDVLKGLKNSIEKSHPVLIVEVSKDRSKEGEVEEIYKFIKDFKQYSIYKLAGGKERVSRLIPVENMDDLPEHDNIICIASA